MNFSKVAVYIHVCTSKMKIHDRSVLAKLLAQYAVLLPPYNVEAYRNSNFSHTCRQRTVRPLPCTHFVSTPPTTTPPASATTYTSSTCAGQVCNIVGSATWSLTPTAVLDYHYTICMYLGHCDQSDCSAHGRQRVRDPNKAGPQLREPNLWHNHVNIIFCTKSNKQLHHQHFLAFTQALAFATRFNMVVLYAFFWLGTYVCNG